MVATRFHRFRRLFSRLPASPILLSVLFLACVGQYLLTQRQISYTLYGGLAFFAVSLFLFQRLLPRETNDFIPAGKISREAWWLGFILLLAAFFRFYRLGSLPAGIFVDSSTVGLGGLAVLNEGWRPFYENVYSTHPGLVYYLSAAWFALFEPTPFHLLLFFAALSMLSLAFFYWTFRELCGARTALIALFLLAVMRWEVASSRGYPLHDSILCMFATLAFWLYALRRRAAWAFCLSAVFFALGLYTYHGYKLFVPLMLFYGIYEVLREPARIKRTAKPLAAFILIFLVLISPLIVHWLRQGSVGGYETSLLVWGKMKAEKSLMPLIQNAAQAALCFNRKGDPTSYCNFASHRMLDDVTGILFILGLGMAFRFWKNRPFFYALAGLFVMSLNCVLTLDAISSSARRLFAVTPFIALLGAMAVSRLFGEFQRSFFGKKAVVRAVFLLMLLAAGAQNFHQYFILQARDPGYYRVCDPDTTDIAGKISRDGGQYDFYLDSRYYKNRTIHFIDYYKADDYNVLDWPKDLAFARLNEGKAGVCFVLGEGREGVFQLLRQWYPRAETETLRDLDGSTMVYYVKVSREELSSETRRLPARGLKAEYRTDDQSDKADHTQWDPIINFPHRTNLAVISPPLSVKWEGRLLVKEEGKHDFVAITEPEDQAQIWLDGKPLTGFQPNASATVDLKKGRHSISIRFRMGSGFYSAISLAWKRPGKNSYEIIPNDCFGMVH
jgi:4-amino-4-deoxy-L-arabinose transferase-like glycosyltransferase